MADVSRDGRPYRTTQDYTTRSTVHAERAWLAPPRERPCAVLPADALARDQYALSLVHSEPLSVQAGVRGAWNSPAEQLCGRAPKSGLGARRSPLEGSALGRKRGPSNPIQVRYQTALRPDRGARV